MMLVNKSFGTCRWCGRVLKAPDSGRLVVRFERHARNCTSEARRALEAVRKALPEAAT